MNRATAWRGIVGRWGVACVLLASFAGSIAQPAELPAAVTQALNESGIAARSLAVVVQSVDGGAPLVSHNARQPMNPASVMKLVTTYAGLELLGPAFTWRTEVLSDRTPNSGRLDGHVYLRGSGDPRLGLEQFWLLLRQLRARGLSEIGGDLVLDRSAFAPAAHNPGDFDNEPLRPYNAGPDALLVNLKSVRLSLLADAANKAVKVIVDTPADGLRIENRLSLGREACGDWREQIRPQVSGSTLELNGVFPAACGEKALHLAPWPANEQVESLFRALWRELGGSFAGRVREGRTPATAHTLAVHESPPLGEVIREINKFSNNVMARQVFLTLDADRPATADGARRRISAWLHGKGLQAPDLAIENGSGLSRSERISADSLTQILRAAWQSAVMPELISSLPLAGVDGTLRKRLNDSSTSGRAHLKTGYLEGVRAIAGYALDSRQRRWIVVCLINDPKARLGKPVIDALLGWLSRR